MMKKKIITLFSLCISFFAVAQKLTPLEYCAKFAGLAKSESARSGVPAAITLAQGILESESGNSELALKSNNHFGIKCKSTWQGEKVYHDDDARGECFRKYPKVEDSYVDHSDFLKNNTRYAFLFSLDKQDYTGWAKGLKKAGYATNPVYAQKLIELIEKYKLYEYDRNTGTTKDAENNTSMEVAYPVPPVEENKIAVVVPEPELSSNASLEKIIYINETKAILAPKDIAWLRIAEKYNLSLSKLLEYNDLEKNNQDIVEQDRLVFLQRKKKQGVQQFHVVQEPETLYDIAQAEGIRLDSLRKKNNLPENAKLKTGDKILLK